MSVSMDTDFRGGPLSDANLRRASSDIGDHIQAGGSPIDPIGTELVQRFVIQLARYSDFTVFTQTRGLNTQDVCAIVKIAILLGQRGILPTLFVRDVVGDILVGCVLVQKSPSLGKIAYLNHLQLGDPLDSRFASDLDLFEANSFRPETVQLALAVEQVGKEHIDFIHSKNPISNALVTTGSGLKKLPEEHSTSGCMALLCASFFSILAAWMFQKVAFTLVL